MEQLFPHTPASASLGRGEKIGNKQRIKLDRSTATTWKCCWEREENARERKETLAQHPKLIRHEARCAFWSFWKIEFVWLTFVMINQVEPNENLGGKQFRLIFKNISLPINLSFWEKWLRLIVLSWVYAISYLIYSRPERKRGTKSKNSSELQSFPSQHKVYSMLFCYFLFSFTFPLFFFASQHEKWAEIYYVVVL